ncbi:hypothetical protein [Sphingomonas sp. ID0503]|uniref:hypothetical protein n=1 Tax=Sphingomonas sp. ID0503 TaxID=3399691 RepID=UPI003AFA35EF
MVRQFFFVILMIASCGYAIVRGGIPERVVAISYVVCTVLTVLLLRSVDVRYAGLELGVMFVDIGLLAVMLAVALMSERYWPLWMTAMQAMTVLANLGRLLPQVRAWTYWNAITLWSYPMLVLLIVATVRHQRRLRAPASAGSF